MYVNCVGMIRSGSTLQYNIVAELLELKNIGQRVGWEHYKEFYKIKERCKKNKLNVFKNHFLTDEIENELKKVDNSTLMYVYRDIRDICVSMMEKEDKTFEQIFNSKALNKAIESSYKILKSPLNTYITSYEIMLLNTKKEIKEIANYLNIKITSKEIEMIYEKISFDAQKENIKKYKKDNNYILNGKQKFNPDTLLHLNHIKDGKIGKYRERLSKAQIKRLEDEFSFWIVEHGYKLESKENQIEPILKYYSQHGEDYLLWKFFDYKKEGVFIEVGAFDGVYFSNSYSFELEGWEGICIEPGQYFNNCKNNRPNSICLNAACISDESIDEIIFYEEEVGLLSSVECNQDRLKDMEKRYKNRKLEFAGFKEKKVKAQTLNKILESNNIHIIDFISIDVEGTELEVLKGFNLEKYLPKIVILEANDGKHKKELIEYMTVQNNYFFAREISVNLFFVKNKDDFNKLNNIEINCSIEKQEHPLGIKYTNIDYLLGLKIINGEKYNQLLNKNYQELLKKQILINQNNKELEQVKVILSESISQFNNLINGIKKITNISVKIHPINKYKAYKELVKTFIDASNQKKFELFTTNNKSKIVKQKFSHIINPVKVNQSSDLFRAQPITFETMKNAKLCANINNISVEQFATNFKEDQEYIPSYLIKTHLLTRSILDFDNFSKQKKLPLLVDILENLYISSNAKYMIYTNVDIALMPHFYITLEKIMEEGYDAVNIFRRTLDNSYNGINDIEHMYADLGTDHPGTDCFVFKRELFEKFDLQNIAIGARFVALALRVNLFAFSKKIKEFNRLHMTFHIGDDRSWNSLDDFSLYNEKELDKIFENLFKRKDVLNIGKLEELYQNFESRKKQWRKPNVQ